MWPGGLHSHESGEKQRGTGGLMGQGNGRAACSFLHTDFCLEESPIWQESDVWKYWWWETLGLSQAAFIPPAGFTSSLGQDVALSIASQSSRASKRDLFSPLVCVVQPFPGA